MFWAEKIADEVVRRYASHIDAGEPLVIRDEKTASGRVHVGSLRSAALHGIVADVLRSRGIATRFLFEINDFDPMDSIPGYLDASEYQKYMGVQLYRIPSPEKGFENFAELYGQEYVRVLEEIGFDMEVYRASELYLSGKMNDAIRTVLEKRDVIRKIYKEVSGSQRNEDWYPLNVVCANCGTLSSTRVTDFDGETVGYVCSSDTISWAEGCGHEGRISPFDGNAKLPWKLEWAAKFQALEVQFEGGGKDHYSRGGAREVAEAICREVFLHEPPYGVFNEFFLIGGKKMSSSKGNAASAAELAALLPSHILRLLLIRTPINRQIDFDPNGDSIPVLFDTYDRLAEKYWADDASDDREVFLFSHAPAQRIMIEKRFLPRFSQIAFLVQMPHMDVAEEVAKMKGDALTEADKDELQLRIEYARRWLDRYAADEYIFKLQTSIPEAVASLSEGQQAILGALAVAIENTSAYDGQSIHELTHEVKKDSRLSPQEFFGALYTAFLGKDHGPKAGWFLSTLDKDFVVKRLRMQE